MIKKTITVLSMLILSTALMWAVWEGNAAAGSREDFPSGLFASSDLFPKYTLIEISNLEQNTKSRAVVIDDTGSDGLLVKVSPDLAKALAIKAGSTVRVRVSIPPLVAEEGADPVLLSKTGNKRSASSKTPTAEDSEVISEETPAQEDIENPAGEPPAQSEPASQEVTEPVQPVTEREEESAEPVRVAQVEEPLQPETVPEEPVVTIAEVLEPVLSEPENLPAPVPEVTEPTESPAQSECSAEAEQPVPVVLPIQEPPVQEGSESSGEYEKPVLQVAEIVVPADIAESEEYSVPEVSSPIEPQPVVMDEVEHEKNAEEPELLAGEPEETQPEPIDEPEIVTIAEVEPEKETEEPAAEPETVAAAALPEEDSTENEAVEQHAMLVPAEPREPVGEHIPVPKETEKPAIPTSPVATRPAEESYTANVLTKGSFYVQVGRFKDILNVESFVQMYGKQYPVAIEKSSTTKDVFYKVYVGPLQKDERGAALETFQKLGFKDAFLKKAP